MSEEKVVIKSFYERHKFTIFAAHVSLGVLAFAVSGPALAATTVSLAAYATYKNRHKDPRVVREVEREKTPARQTPQRPQPQQESTREENTREKEAAKEATQEKTNANQRPSFLQRNAGKLLAGGLVAAGIAGTFLTGGALPVTLSIMAAGAGTLGYLALTRAKTPRPAAQPKTSPQPIHQPEQKTESSTLQRTQEQIRPVPGMQQRTPEPLRQNQNDATRTAEPHVTQPTAEQPAPRPTPAPENRAALSPKFEEMLTQAWNDSGRDIDKFMYAEQSEKDRLQERIKELQDEKLEQDFRTFYYDHWIENYLELSKRIDEKATQEELEAEFKEQLTPSKNETASHAIIRARLEDTMRIYFRKTFHPFPMNEEEISTAENSLQQTAAQERSAEAEQPAPAPEAENTVAEQPAAALSHFDTLLRQEWENSGEDISVFKVSGLHRLKQQINFTEDVEKTQKDYDAFYDNLYNAEAEVKNYVLDNDVSREDAAGHFAEQLTPREQESTAETVLRHAHQAALDESFPSTGAPAPKAEAENTDKPNFESQERNRAGAAYAAAVADLYDDNSAPSAAESVKNLTEAEAEKTVEAERATETVEAESVAEPEKTEPAEQTPQEVPLDLDTDAREKAQALFEQAEAENRPVADVLREKYSAAIADYASEEEHAAAQEAYRHERKAALPFHEAQKQAADVLNRAQAENRSIKEILQEKYPADPANYASPEEHAEAMEIHRYMRGIILKQKAATPKSVQKKARQLKKAVKQAPAKQHLASAKKNAVKKAEPNMSAPAEKTVVGRPDIKAGAAKIARGENQPLTPKAKKAEKAHRKNDAALTNKPADRKSPAQTARAQKAQARKAQTAPVASHLKTGSIRQLSVDFVKVRKEYFAQKERLLNNRLDARQRAEAQKRAHNLRSQLHHKLMKMAERKKTEEGKQATRALLSKLLDANAQGKPGRVYKSTEEQRLMARIYRAQTVHR